MINPSAIFDGHNDVLLRLFKKQTPGAERLFFAGEDEGQLDFPRAIKGGFAGGMFAIFIPPKDDRGDVNELMRGASYDVVPPSVNSAEDTLPSVTGSCVYPRPIPWCSQSIKVRNSCRVMGLSRKQPNIRLVTKSVSALCTPRVVMQ